MGKMDTRGARFTVMIPDVPPGINQQYKYGKGNVRLSDAANAWKEKAALIIGARAGELGWRYGGGTYRIGIRFSVGKGRRELDFDAPIKIITDTLAEKLGFPDDSPRYFVLGSIETIKAAERFVIVFMEPYDRVVVREGESWLAIAKFLEQR